MKIGKGFWYIHLGMLLIALDIHLFKTPNHFALGGTSGISILVRYYLPQAPVGILMFILNLIFLIFGYFILGKKFTVNTIYSSMMLSVMVYALDLLFPIKSALTNQKLMELIYSVFLPGIGNALVFSQGTTTGGTDILGKIMSKVFKIRISVSMLILDFIIASSTGILFGAEAFLFSILGVCLKSFILDSVMESIHVFKILVIISDKNGEIKEYICKELNRGATLHQAYGAFTNMEHDVITTILNRREASQLQNYIKMVDPKAFISITNSSHIIGNGFDRFD